MRNEKKKMKEMKRSRNSEKTLTSCMDGMRRTLGHLEPCDVCKRMGVTAETEQGLRRLQQLSAHSRVPSVLFVLETIRTGAMRVIHIPVKDEETQRLRIKFVLYCPICALDLKIKRAILCRNKTVKCSMIILRASRSAIIAEAFLSTRPP